MAKGFSIKVDMSRLGMDELVAGAEKAARPAAQAGAQVVYDQVRANVARIKRHTGNLASSIYQAYSPDNSNPGQATYHISWNARRAPHGHLVEHGHLMRYRVVRDARTGRLVTLKNEPINPPVLVAARPFLRPAVAAFPRAEEAMRVRFLSELQAGGHL